MTTGSIFWFVIIASSGGVLVLVGLLMERFSERDWHKNLSDFRRCKSVRVWGEWIVIAGIVVEIGVGILSALDAWKNDPLNRPIRDMAAVVSFKVKGGDFKEINMKEMTHGSMSSVAYLNICETNGQVSDLMPGTLYADNFSKGYVESSLASDRLYWMRFSVEDVGSHVGNERPAKEIDKIKSLFIAAWFLPKNTEILGGHATIIINSGIQKDFEIPPQKDLNTNHGVLGMPIIIFGTNAAPAKLQQSPNQSSFALHLLW
jgi:hypothetical protein